MIIYFAITKFVLLLTSQTLIMAKKEITKEEKILQHLKDNGQMLKWLASSVGISVGHLHSVLKGKRGVKRNLTEKNLEKINQTLNTNF